MTDFFKLSAVSKKRHLELVEEKSDIYDSPEVYGLNYQEMIVLEKIQTTVLALLSSN